MARTNRIWIADTTHPETVELVMEAARRLSPI
jgi:hypothetical protein